MRYKIIGGLAAKHNGIKLNRKSLDMDLVGDREGAMFVANSFGNVLEVQETETGIIVFIDDGDEKRFPIECELIEKRQHTESLYLAMTAINPSLYASNDWLYFLKMSHRYKKDSPHFWKTRNDIDRLERAGARMPYNSEELFKERESLTYTNKLPNLNVSSKTFFKEEDSFYVYDHDSIHEAIAVDSKPAYKNYMKDGSEVMTSKEKFFACDYRTRLLGVYEESCVLALERSQIPNDFKPHPEQSFMKALEKVCTSITGGYFRQWGYTHIYEVIKFYNGQVKGDYVKRFKGNIHMVKPFKGKMYETV